MRSVVLAIGVVGVCALLVTATLAVILLPAWEAAIATTCCAITGLLIDDQILDLLDRLKVK